MATNSAMHRGLLFFRRFLGSPREVGALLPSTRHLGAEMVRNLPLRSGDVVIEYGPGTGALTSAIADHIARTPGVRYLGIERDAAFVEVLQRRFPQLEFATDSVENVRVLLAARSLPAPRAILSGLPLVLLPAMESILTTAAAVLQPGGEFRTFSYLQSWPLPGAFRLRRMFREHFASHGRSRLVLGNVPPAWVLRGTVAGSPAAAPPHPRTALA